MSFPLDSEGVWCEVLRRPPPGRPALFLDRDGVVVEDQGYLHRPEEVALIDGAARLIAAANARGVTVVLVTNQGGVGRSYYSWQDFADVQRVILAELAALGAQVDAVYAAPHHPEGHGEWRHADHPARKPNAGMLTRGAAEFASDLSASWMVGDKRSDVVAAQRAGLRGALHVLTGQGADERPQVEALALPGLDVRLGHSILDALDLPLMRDAAS